ncbi:MAG: xanthine dehydrogenase family protein molybdopterin-binding subunit [bacterium]|nr:xanthine dehydrogenase family protein molybdopterin-binding subunit [bacterium]
MSGRTIAKDSYFIEDEKVETIAEVSEGVTELEEPAKLKVIGKPISRIDGYDKVSGSAVYTFDKTLPRMAFAATLRCPHPHAEIKSLDTSKAEKIKGVLAVISSKNTSPIPVVMTFLFDPHLRFAGDEVACVAAESPEIAQEALKHIKVEYKVLPFVVDPEKAMKPGAPKLYPKGNVFLFKGKPNIYKRGDAKKGLEEAEVLVTQTFKTQVEVHNPLEFHCSVVNWDGDSLTIWDSPQAIFSVRQQAAAALKIPESKVRVIKKYMGGGFGSKLGAGKYTIMAALLARQIGRPVKIVLDRKEQNLAVGNRPDSIQALKIGLKKDGTITALSHHNTASSGAGDWGGGNSWPLRTLYRCPNVHIKEYFVFINAGTNCAFRAPGHVQGTFALESLMDMAAEKLGMDPLQLRMKNYADKDQAFNLPYTSKYLKEAYEKGAAAFGWKRRKAAGADKGPIKRGMGMASQIWWGSGGAPAYATLKLNHDGSAIVQCGSQDLGTGTYTFIAQIVAEVLEMPMDKITVVLGDTAVCPFAPISGGSMTAASVSPAVYDAALQMKAKLMSGAAAVLGVPKEKLVYSRAEVLVKDEHAKKVAVHQLIGKMQERVLVTTGARNANPEGYMTNTFGAQFAEVEVDTMSGNVKVLKVTAAHDIGRVLNKKTMESQLHGGITMGIGFALLEQRIIDQSTGRVMNTNFHDYKVPTINDIPDIEVISVGLPDTKLSSTGVKGVGEPATIPTAAAIANAVYNALGVRINSLPITPDKVLAAVNGLG